MSKDTQTPAGYVFAQAPDETRRLKRQAVFLSRFTHFLLDTAGLTSGMNVLDVGTGIGDVAFLVAERVGPPVSPTLSFSREMSRRWRSLTSSMPSSAVPS